MEIVAPQNCLLVKVDHPYIGNISNVLKMSAIQNGASVDAADLVNIVGDVVSLPIKITNEKRGYEGFSTKDIQAGDTVIFRFDVIYEFKMLSKTEKTYANRIWYNGKEYWLCDIQKVFAVIRDGEIRMVNGYVMLTDFEPSKIILSQSQSIIRRAQKATVMQIGSPKTNVKPIDVGVGNTVFFNPINTAQYQIKGKPFRIIQQDKILGRAE